MTHFSLHDAYLPYHRRQLRPIALLVIQSTHVLLVRFLLQRLKQSGIIFLRLMRVFSTLLVNPRPLLHKMIEHYQSLLFYPFLNPTDIIL